MKSTRRFEKRPLTTSSLRLIRSRTSVFDMYCA